MKLQIPTSSLTWPRRALVTLIFGGCLTVIAIAAFSAGVLDPGYGTSGRVLTAFGGSDFANAIVLQSDGKVVIAGGTYNGISTTNFALGRFNTNGTLDSTFGTSGKVITNFTGNDTANALVLQPDGKIVAAGGDDDFKLARYNTNGTLDTTFGTGGKVSTDFSGAQDSANALVIQPDGKLVAAGVVSIGSNYVFGLARYNANGTLDGTFGAGGKVSIDRTGLASALVRQPDGKLVAGGTFDGGFGLIRYNTNGTVDTSFGVNGEVTIRFDPNDFYAEVNALVLQADGKLVAAGYSYGFDDGQTFALARFTSGGALDTTFGTGGKVTTRFAGFDWANALALQTDGKLVAAGLRDNGSNRSFALARYNTNGALDATFGLAGIVVTDFTDTSDDEARGLIIQGDGKIIAAGRSGGSVALARYADTNTAQTTFTISGQALSVRGDPVDGATITLSGSSFSTKTTDTNGFYKFTGLSRNGNYTITPSKTVQTSAACNGAPHQVCFSPSQISITSLGQDLFAQDFVAFAPTVTISGRVTKNSVGLAGVSITTCVPIQNSYPGRCSYQTATTNSSGFYNLANLPVLNNYFVQAEGSGLIINPGSLFFGNLENDVAGADFAAADAITIGGHLRNVNGRGLSGESVFLSGDSSNGATTDGDGGYSFTVASGGNYTVAPSDSRVSQWLPQNQLSFSALNQSVSNADFEAHFPSFTVSGAFKNSAGANLTGMKVRLTGTNITTKDYTTNSSGAYTSDQLNVLGDYIFTPQSGTVGGISYSSFNPTTNNFFSMPTCSSNCSGFDYLGIDYVATASPSATTGAANPIATTTATLNGTVNPNGVATNAWFEWGTDPTLVTNSKTSSQAKVGTTSQSISQALSSLVPGTTYYFRTGASSAGGTVGGSIVPFTTTLPARTLTVASSNPASGVSVVVSPNDNNAAGNGVTQFTRVYNNTTVVSLTAPATASGNNFQKWLKDGADFANNTVANVSVTMDADHTMTAVFITPRILTVSSSNPASGVAITVTPNDNNAAGNGTTQFTRIYNNTTVVSLTAPANASGNNFQKWLKDGADFANNTLPNVSVTMDAAHTMTAVYLTPTRTLTVASSNPAIGVAITISPTDNNAAGNGTTQFTRIYNNTTVVSLTAQATADGNNFQKWLKDGADFANNTLANVSVTMDADHTMTAVYLTPTRTLTVASSNPASGVNITVSPNDNAAAGNGTTQFTRIYNNNQVVSLTAAASAGGNNFQKWLKDSADFAGNTSANASVTMDANHTMTAVYVSPTRTLTVASTNPASGVAISTSPADNNAAGNGTTQFTRLYNDNQNVVLTAPATVGTSIFQKWQRDGIDFATSPQTNLTMDADHTLTAVFVTAKTIQFDAANYSAAENVSSKVITVTRAGDTSAPATVDYTTSDSTGASPCDVLNTGNASSRCDYETTIGTLNFAAGEISKTITIPIIDDSYAEGSENLTVTLSNANGASLATPSTATVSIIDNDSSNGTNPVGQARYFVRMHYLDFLNREPDTAGWDFWTNQITNCGSDVGCTEVRRVDGSASFFLSIEFQQTGYLVERAYKSAYGDTTGTSTFNGAHQLTVPIVRFNEFLADTQQITRGVVVLQTGWEQLLESNKVAFFNEFVQRARFTAAEAFPTSMTPTDFVTKLDARAGNPLTATERNQLISDLTANTKTRAQVLRAVAEHPNLVVAEFNRAFVLMQYFGYLRRNPNDPQDSDYTGYDFWLTKLNQFNGNYNAAEMVKAFITSIEYGQRFGP